MPIRLEWGNPEKTILLEVIDGEWTLADIHAMLSESDAMIASVPHTVHIIGDLTKANAAPSNLLGVLGRAQRTQPYNTGMIIAVRANSFLKSIADVAAKLWPDATRRFRFVDTMEEAFQILDENPSFY